MQPDKELLESAQRNGCPVLRSCMVTTSFALHATAYLERILSPHITRHGVLVDVNGVGLLLIGESGIGKSETALELVERGHRLVADDVVEISVVGEDQLIGTSPVSVRHFMEIRGVGIIDIRSMFGVGSVLVNKTIDLVVRLETWDNNKSYDRLGLDTEYIDILDVKIPIITVPVQPGRNLGVILEVAARNHQLKVMGYNAAQEINRRFNEANRVEKMD
jgi:HPr kinase/phosphorylase